MEIRLPRALEQVECEGMERVLWWEEEWEEESLWPLCARQGWKIVEYVEMLMQKEPLEKEMLIHGNTKIEKIWNMQKW